MAQILPILVAAAIVAALHMSAPDHWVTLCMLARASQWNRLRLVAVSLVTAVGHVTISVLSGLAVVAVGMVLTQAVSRYVNQAVGLIMPLAGGSYGIWVLASHQKEDYGKMAEEERAKISRNAGRGVGYFAVLGAALSPDLTILPIFLLAIPIGIGAAAYAGAVYAVGAILALITFVLIGSWGLSEAFQRIPPKYNDALVGFAIAAVGVYVLLGG